jgi:hypothetical protein
LTTVHQDADGKVFDVPVLARWRAGAGEILVSKVDLMRCLSTLAAGVMMAPLTALPVS